MKTINYMSQCSHRWIGDTCTECGVNWGVWAARRIPQLEMEVALVRAEIAESDSILAELHKALIHARLRREEAKLFPQREMVPKDDLLLTQGMLEQSREHVKQAESKVRDWKEMASLLHDALIDALQGDISTGRAMSEAYTRMKELA